MLEATATCLDCAVDLLARVYLAYIIDEDALPSIMLGTRSGASRHPEEVPPSRIKGLVWQVYRQTAESWKNLSRTNT